MENKKTLWIIAAVGVFLLIALGPVVFMYSGPSKASQTTARASSADRQYKDYSNPNGDSRPGADGFIPSPAAEHQLNFPNRDKVASEQQPLRANEVYVVADKANVYEAPSSGGTTIDLNSLKTLKNESPAQNINVTVTFADQEKPAAVRERAPRDFERPAPKKEAAPKADAAPKVAEAKSAKPAPVAAKKAEPKKTQTAKAAPKAPEAPSKYWVQVAAYSNKKGAETARSTLGTNQIQADIFTYKDNKENLFYRVRVGPYTTKSEAEYWRQKIAKINDFANAKSYVTATN